MAPRIYLALAIHNHQPVGNFDHVFEAAYRQAYQPMLEALERHPGVRLALHYTGCLRDWLLTHHPDFFPRLRALVERGQVEMMTGAYHEPILAVIPDADKQGQIGKLTRAVWEDFGYRATGFWLAERVWEPHLAKPLAQAGIEYTIVDDTHFKYVGVKDEELFGYYVTEEQGFVLKIFGTSKHLRYTIPWAPVEEVIAWLRSQVEERFPPKVAVMGDDGEKFGLWPGTYEHCWQNGWMERFFSALEENADWLQTIPPGEYAARFPSLGRIYLPTASYDEMTEWALPAPLARDIVHLKHRLQDEGRTDVLRFVRGGFWRHFLVKYPEINTMHKKMLRVSEKVHSLGEGRPKEEALNHLWAGQCNCPYWHGVFGGIYLFHIRAATWKHLLTAENLADRAQHGTGPWLQWQILDFDRDASPEILLESDALNLYFDPADGGSLFEWDWRAKSYNLLNTLSRRPEGYHRDLVEAGEKGETVWVGAPEGELETIHTTRVRVKEPDLHLKLFYDWYRRASFIDHVLHPDTSLEDFYRARYGELGDFVNQPYAHQVEEESEGELTLSLWREGHFWQGDRLLPLRVEKRFRLRAGEPRLDVIYIVTNTSEEEIRLRFGVETNWGIVGGNGPGARYLVPGGGDFPLDSKGEWKKLGELRLVARPLGMEVRMIFHPLATLWRFPIETISNSEAGFERGYQGSCLLAWWEPSLKPGERWEAKMSFLLR